MRWRSYNDRKYESPLTPALSHIEEREKCVLRHVPVFEQGWRSYNQKAKTLDPRLRMSRMTEGEVGDDKRNGLLKHGLQLRGAFDDFSLGVDRDERG